MHLGFHGAIAFGNPEKDSLSALTLNEMRNKIERVYRVFFSERFVESITVKKKRLKMLKLAFNMFFFLSQTRSLI